MLYKRPTTTCFAKQQQQQQNHGEEVSWSENIENALKFAFEHLVLLSCQYVCNVSTPCFESELLGTQAYWFNHYQSVGASAWFVDLVRDVTDTDCHTENASAEVIVSEIFKHQFLKKQEETHKSIEKLWVCRVFFSLAVPVDNTHGASLHEAARPQMASS